MGNDAPAHAQEFCSQIEPGASGEVRLYARPNESPCLTIEKRGPILVVDANGGQLFTIQRKRRFPSAIHAMYQGDTLVWTLTSRSVLRNRYEIEVVGDNQWKFRTPFFSVGFNGTANDGSEVLGRVGRRVNERYFLVAFGKESIQFLSAPAFLHRYWYFHG